MISFSGIKNILFLTLIVMVGIFSIIYLKRSIEELKENHKLGILYDDADNQLREHLLLGVFGGLLALSGTICLAIELFSHM